jgi:hypothetical protein
MEDVFPDAETIRQMTDQYCDQINKELKAKQEKTYKEQLKRISNQINKYCTMGIYSFTYKDSISIVPAVIEFLQTKGYKVQSKCDAYDGDSETIISWRKEE